MVEISEFKSELFERAVWNGQNQKHYQIMGVQSPFRAEYAFHEDGLPDEQSFAFRAQ